MLDSETGPLRDLDCNGSVPEPFRRPWGAPFPPVPDWLDTEPWWEEMDGVLPLAPPPGLLPPPKEGRADTESSSSADDEAARGGRWDPWAPEAEAVMAAVGEQPDPEREGPGPKRRRSSRVRSRMEARTAPAREEEASALGTLCRVCIPPTTIL